MASFDGVPMFGEEVMMAYRQNPRESQIVTFFGVNGFFKSDGGSRGGTMTVRGKVVGFNLSDLANALATIQNYQNGNEYVLVDTKFQSWMAELTEMGEAGEIQYNAADDRYQQKYECSFLLRY